MPSVEEFDINDIRQSYGEGEGYIVRVRLRHAVSGVARPVAVVKSRTW